MRSSSSCERRARWAASDGSAPPHGFLGGGASPPRGSGRRLHLDRAPRRGGGGRNLRPRRSPRRPLRSLRSGAAELSSTTTAYADRLFSRIVHEAAEEAARARIEQEMKFDPDLWLVDIEDRQGRPFLELVSGGIRPNYPRAVHLPLTIILPDQQIGRNAETKWLRSCPLPTSGSTRPRERAARQRRDRDLSGRARRISRPAAEPAGEAASAPGRSGTALGRANRLRPNPG